MSLPIYMTEKLKSLCTIEQLIDGQWLQFGEPRELTFIAPSNGLYSPDPERLQAANDFVKQEMGESFRVIKAEGQTFFVDACGPQGTQGTQGTPGKHDTLIQNPVFNNKTKTKALHSKGNAYKK